MTSRRTELELFHALAGDGTAVDLAELSDRLRRCTHWVLNRMTGGSALWGEVEEIVDEARGPRVPKSFMGQAKEPRRGKNLSLRALQPIEIPTMDVSRMAEGGQADRP